MNNPFVRNFFQILRIHLSGYYVKCPIVGVLKAINSTWSKGVLTMLPWGTYDLRATIYDKNVGPKQLKVKYISNHSLLPD